MNIGTNKCSRRTVNIHSGRPRKDDSIVGDDKNDKCGGLQMRKLKI